MANSPAPKRSLIWPPNPRDRWLGPEAVRGVDLIVVTIPENNIPSLPAGLFADTPDRVVASLLLDRKILYRKAELDTWAAERWRRPRQRARRASSSFLK